MATKSPKPANTPADRLALIATEIVKNEKRADRAVSALMTLVHDDAEILMVMLEPYRFRAAMVALAAAAGVTKKKWPAPVEITPPGRGLIASRRKTNMKNLGYLADELGPDGEPTAIGRLQLRARSDEKLNASLVKLKSAILDEWKLDSGTALGDATTTDLALEIRNEKHEASKHSARSAFYLGLHGQMKPGQRVRDAFSAAEVERIRREALA